MKIVNRINQCEDCGSRLHGDKSPYTSEEGFIYRTRVCRECACVYYTKQAAEEVTGKEVPESNKHAINFTYFAKQEASGDIGSRNKNIVSLEDDEARDLPKADKKAKKAKPSESLDENYEFTHEPFDSAIDNEGSFNESSSELNVSNSCDDSDFQDDDFEEEIDYAALLNSIEPLDFLESLEGANTEEVDYIDPEYDYLPNLPSSRSEQANNYLN